MAASLHRGREGDGVVEGQTKRLVHLLTALSTIEERLLDIVADGEQSTARRISSSVYTIWASNTLGDRG